MSVANVINEIDQAPDEVANFKTTGIKADVIAESTAATGVTIDGVKLKDSEVTTDVINEKTSATGVTIDSVVLKDGGVTSSGVSVRAGGDKTLAIVVPDANTTILAANSGKTHYVANVSADRTFTLPSAAAGLYYEFQATLIAADGNDWIIVTGSDTNFFLGGVLHFVSDTVDINLAVPNGTDDATIQVNLPSVGTCVKMYCDGTNWFLSGHVFSVPIPTFT